VVSEKKRFFSETTWTIETKLPRNDHWKVLYKVSVFYADRKSTMAATTGHSINTGPYGENTEYVLLCRIDKDNQRLSRACIVHLAIKKNNWSYVKTMSCSGSHLGIPINIKNTKFVKDLPMMFNIGPYGENVSKRFFSETTWTVETKLPRNDHWKVLCFLCRSKIQDGCHHRS
jgi:hypothetical protein